MILDTNAVSSLFGGDRAIEKLLSQEDRHQLPVIVVGEFAYGLKNSRAHRQLRKLLDELVNESDILEIDLGTTNFYADIRAGLRERGAPIPENDLWIAALCLQHRHLLASRDRHFDRIPRLKRSGW